AAVASAVTAPEGEGLSEAGQALLGRRESKPAEMLFKAIPPGEGEQPGSLRGLGRMGLGLATDPLTYVELGGLTGAGRIAEKATPGAFRGAEALSHAEAVGQGLKRTVGLRVPFTGLSVPIVRRVVDAAVSQATSGALERTGNLFRNVAYRGAGKTVID